MSSDSVHIDVAIFRSFQNGNEAAYTKIFHQYYPRVYHFARRYVSDDDAQDVAVEAFFKIWEKRTDFESSSHLSSTLFVITRNRCYKLISKQQNQEKRLEELSTLIDAEQSDFTVEPVREELLALLYSQLDLLPEKTRAVFLLSFQEGLKPAQIAEMLGVSVKTVKNQKVTAIKLLRTAVSGHRLEIFLISLLYAEKMGGS